MQFGILKYGMLAIVLEIHPIYLLLYIFILSVFSIITNHCSIIYKIISRQSSPKDRCPKVMDEENKLILELLIRTKQIPAANRTSKQTTACKQIPNEKKIGRRTAQGGKRKG